MSIAVSNGGRFSHIFNYSASAEESDARWQDIEIVIETHEYLIKIYFLKYFPNLRYLYYFLKYL